MYSTWSSSQTMLAVPPMGTTGPATLPLNVLLLEEQHQEPVLHHLEFAVSSPLLVEEVVVPTTHTLSSPPTPPALTATPAPTPSVPQAPMSAS